MTLKFHANCKAALTAFGQLKGNWCNFVESDAENLDSAASRATLELIG